jgi:hypothetical protein
MNGGGGCELGWVLDTDEGGKLVGKWLEVSAYGSRVVQMRSFRREQRP